MRLSDAYHQATGLYQSRDLPLAATYIVQPDGKILWARVDADWRKRPEPEELLQVVTDSVRNNAAD